MLLPLRDVVCMKSSFVFFSLLLFCFSSCRNETVPTQSADKKFMYVDFDEAIGAERIGKTYFQSHQFDQKRYEECANTWKKEASRASLSEKEMAAALPKIPKCIHQVWLDDEPLPKHFRKYARTWQDKHPGWQYRLWHKESVSELSQDVQQLIQETHEVYEKENILRAAVLEKFGGLFVDFEFECLQAVDALHFRYDFYTALEPPLLKPRFDRVLQIGTGFIASRANHPILKKWMEEMKVRLKRNSLQFDDAREKDLWATYSSFGAVVDEMLAKDAENNVVLPPTYVYPISPRWIYSFNKTEYLKKKKALKSEIKKILSKQECPLFSKVQPESFAVNHAGGAWGKIRSKSKYAKRAIIRPDSVDTDKNMALIPKSNS